MPLGAIAGHAGVVPPSGMLGMATVSVLVLISVTSFEPLLVTYRPPLGMNASPTGLEPTGTVGSTGPAATWPVVAWREGVAICSSSRAGA